EERAPFLKRPVQQLRLVSDQPPHRLAAAALPPLHAVAHHRAPLAQRLDDLLRGNRVLLLVGFKKDVRKIARRGDLFELLERFDHFVSLSRAQTRDLRLHRAKLSYGLRTQHRGGSISSLVLLIALSPEIPRLR